MPCKSDSECPRGQYCDDDTCRDVVQETGEEKSPYSGAALMSRDVAYETRQLNAYSKFIESEMEEAIEAREQEAKSTDWWGTLTSFVGTAIGCGIGASIAGPTGCKVGATIGGGIGSIGGRGIADWMGDAESVDIDSYPQLKESDLKFLNEEYADLADTASKWQEDLDYIDANEWKGHVMNTLGDTWNAFNIANIGTKVAPGLFTSSVPPTPEVDMPSLGFDTEWDALDIDINTATGESYTAASSSLPPIMGGKPPGEQTLYDFVASGVAEPGGLRKYYAAGGNK